METASRIYDALLAEHLAANRQMAFVSGPRQVGKTTTCRGHAVQLGDFHLGVDRASLQWRYSSGRGSTMGRYFSYRMHPFSVAETVSRELPDGERSDAARIVQDR